MALMADEITERWKYGLYAVGLGLAVLAVCFAIAVWQYEGAADAGTVLAAVTGTIGAIVGAYFGIQVGSAGKDKAEENAHEAHMALLKEKDKSQALLDTMPPGMGGPILDRFR
jgi:hypothetical protein